MTTPDERRGLLDAVERIVNLGDAVVPRTLAAIRRLYPDAELEHGRIVVDGAAPDDAVVLTRVSTLISAHVATAEDG